MARGGKRAGAGRPAGTSKYGEPTKMARIPISLAKRLAQITGKDHQPIVGNSQLIQLALELLEAGLEKVPPDQQDPQTSTAVDEIQRGLSLLKYALAVAQNSPTPAQIDPDISRSLQVGDQCRYIGQDERLRQIAQDKVLIVQSLVTDQFATVIAEGMFVRNFPIADLMPIQSLDLSLFLDWGCQNPSGKGSNAPTLWWENASIRTGFKIPVSAWEHPSLPALSLSMPRPYKKSPLAY